MALPDPRLRLYALATGKTRRPTPQILASGLSARVLPRVDISDCAYFAGRKKSAP
jgi:hypothetical protein